MSDPFDSPNDQEPPEPIRGFSLWGSFQLLTAVGILLAVHHYYGVYWTIISVPVMFAAMAAINFNDVEPVAERRLKRLMSLLTLIACGAAWIYLELTKRAN